MKLLRNLVLAGAAISAVWALDPPVDELDAADEETSAVVKLDDSSFSGVVSHSKYVLVKFYAPWCGHCQAMAAGYIKAAERLIEDGIDVTLAEVDATQATELAKKYNVEGYPTLLWFVDGKPRPYSGQRTPESITEWVTKNVGPVVSVWSEAEMKTEIEARKQVDAIYVFEGEENGKIHDIAEKIANDPKTLGIVGLVKGVSSTPKLTVYKGTKEVVVYEGNLEDFDAVLKWTTENRVPLFGQINEDNFEIYVEAAKKGLLWVCVDPANLKSEIAKYSPAFVEVAKKRIAAGEETYPFVWLDIAEFEAHAKEELGCSTFPTVVLQRGDLMGEQEDVQVEKFLRSYSEKPEDLTEAGVEAFFTDINSGALKPAPMPDPLDGMDDDDDDEDLDVPEGHDEEL